MIGTIFGASLKNDWILQTPFNTGKTAYFFSFPPSATYDSITILNRENERHGCSLPVNDTWTRPLLFPESCTGSQFDYRRG
jgi:hypothetical protein